MFMYLGCYLLNRWRIDDVVGAVPVHLFAGIWGTVAVAITRPDVSILAQLTGILAIGAFVFVLSLGIWQLLRVVRGIRLHPEHETSGGDMAELGIRAYNFS